MRLLLVRHGVTGETGRILTGRLPGVALSDRGRLDAAVVADRMADTPATAAYTSPIRRCRETARIVVAPHGLTPITERRLIEVDYGSWSGRRLADLSRLKAWGRLMAAPARFRFPEGETLGEAQMRAVEAVEELAGRHGTDQVLAVSHADVIRVLLCHYLGMPLDLIHRLHVAPLSLSVVDLAADGTVHVPAVNQVFAPAEVR
jgi:probable phosphoglycerate mutase